MTPERIQELKGRYEGLSPTDITFMTVEELTSLLVVLEEALQTIARQREALEKIKAAEPNPFYHIAKSALEEGETQP
ncbi:hypothetical protein NYE33_20340 [Paenibacillus sp. FSL R10-2199]|uniref:hypothetical protein n=1 Tax=Paenibacillus sp. FSL R10-2199 TaxID=2975348 RepID=UPI0030F6A24F